MNIRRIAAVSILASAAVTGTAAADTNATPTVPIQSISVSVPRPSQPVTVTSRQLDSTIGILPTIDANSPAAAEPLYQYLIMWSELPPTCHTVS